MTTQTPMTRAEHALLLTLMVTASEHAGRISRTAKYAAATEHQRQEIYAALERLLTEIVVGLRVDGPPVTIEELAKVMQLVAVRAVVVALGEPPAIAQGIN